MNLLSGASDGGRLTLLTPSEMTSAQRELVARIEAGRGRRGKEAGYRISTDDGRLVGPFNAFLRAPELGAAYLAWADTNAASSLSPAVTEAVILAVTARWRAPYVRYAHEIAARAAGFTDEDIDSILCGQIPESADSDVAVSLALAGALLDEHRVPDGIYNAARARFSEATIVALVSLIGQYMTTSAILACFAVPAPAGRPPTAH